MKREGQGADPLGMSPPGIGNGGQVDVRIDELLRFSKEEDHRKIKTQCPVGHTPHHGIVGEEWSQQWEVGTLGTPLP